MGVICYLFIKKISCFFRREFKLSKVACPEIIDEESLSFYQFNRYKKSLLRFEYQYFKFSTYSFKHYTIHLLSLQGNPDIKTFVPDVLFEKYINNFKKLLCQFKSLLLYWCFFFFSTIICAQPWNGAASNYTGAIYRTGNVGIGTTTNPISPLSVNGDGDNRWSVTFILMVIIMVL